MLSFGLQHYASSEFELLAEELLMSDAVMKVNDNTLDLIYPRLLFELVYVVYLVWRSFTFNTSDFSTSYLVHNMLYEDCFSTFQVYGALRMSVKMFLMWNSKMLIDGGGDVTVATSLLEASNLVVLKVIFLSTNYFIVVFGPCCSERIFV